MNESQKQRVTITWWPDDTTDRVSGEMWLNEEQMRDLMELVDEEGRWL